MQRLTAIGSLRTEYPQMVASPLVGAKRVERTEIVVVLPAPFGPSRLKISPSLISKEIPLTAVKSSYFLRGRVLREWMASQTPQ